MCGRGRSLHIGNLRVLWTEAHGTRLALERRLRLAQKDLDPASHPPRDGQVRIEREGLVGEHCRAVEIADNIGKGHAGASERDGIVSAEFSHPSGESLGLS